MQNNLYNTGSNISHQQFKTIVFPQPLILKELSLWLTLLQTKWWLKSNHMWGIKSFTYISQFRSPNGLLQVIQVFTFKHPLGSKSNFITWLSKLLLTLVTLVHHLRQTLSPEPCLPQSPWVVDLNPASVK